MTICFFKTRTSNVHQGKHHVIAIKRSHRLSSLQLQAMIKEDVQPMLNTPKIIAIIIEIKDLGQNGILITQLLMNTKQEFKQFKQTLCTSNYQIN